MLRAALFFAALAWSFQTAFALEINSTNCPAGRDLAEVVGIMQDNAPDAVQTILDPAASAAYTETFNATGRPTDYEADLIVFYEAPGVGDIYILFVIGDKVCRHGVIPRNIHNISLNAATGT